VGSLLGILGGAWLMLAPTFHAYQPAGADWIDATYVDFWTGIALVVVSVVGLVAYLLGLVAELRRRGILKERPRPQQPQYAVQPAGAPQGPGYAGGAPQGSGNMDQVLLPLVTAMLQDMQNQRQARETPRTEARPENGPVIHERTTDERSVQR
jgi:hypothetical protein